MNGESNDNNINNTMAEHTKSDPIIASLPQKSSDLTIIPQKPLDTEVIALCQMPLSAL